MRKHRGKHPIANEIPTGLQQQLDVLQEKELRASVIDKYWQENVK